MAAAVQEVFYLGLLFDEMGVVNDGTTVIKEDHQSCIRMCISPVVQKRTKLIHVKIFFVRELVKGETI